MEDYKREMGRRLSAYRKGLHLTQEKVSEMLDISLKHYSELERGITGISVDLLIDISKTLNVSLDYLLIGDNRNVNVSPEFNEKYNSFSPEQQKKILEIMDIICTFDEEKKPHG